MLLTSGSRDCASYVEDGADNPSNGEADFLRDILREAEGYVGSSVVISRYQPSVSRFRLANAILLPFPPCLSPFRAYMRIIRAPP